MSVVRASDRTRHRTRAALARAAGEGFISVETLSWRLNAAFTARDVDRLDALVCDLPWHRRPPAAVLRGVWQWLTGAENTIERLVIPTGTEMVVLGRHPDCDIPLTDAAVSRHHARLRRTPDGWDILDLDSTNGTWLNGRRVTRAVGRPGDVLGLARHALLLPRV